MVSSVFGDLEIATTLGYYLWAHVFSNKLLLCVLTFGNFVVEDLFFL